MSSVQPRDGDSGTLGGAGDEITKRTAQNEGAVEVTQMEAFQAFDRFFSHCSNADSLSLPCSVIKPFELFTPNQHMPSVVYTQLQNYVRSFPGFSVTRQEATPLQRKDYRIKTSAKAYFVYAFYKTPPVLTTEEDQCEQSNRSRRAQNNDVPDDALSFKSKTSAFSPRFRLNDSTNSQSPAPDGGRSFPRANVDTNRLSRDTVEPTASRPRVVDPKTSFVPLLRSPTVATAESPALRPSLPFHNTTGGNAQTSSPLSPYMPPLPNHHHHQATSTTQPSQGLWHPVLGVAPQSVLPGDFVYGDVVSLPMEGNIGQQEQKAMVVGRASPDDHGFDRLLVSIHHERVAVRVHNVTLVKAMPRWGHGGIMGAVTTSPAVPSGRRNVPH